MGKTPWDDHGHSPPAKMKIWLIFKTAAFYPLRTGKQADIMVGQGDT
jgi:hypothetical protein